MGTKQIDGRMTAASEGDVVGLTTAAGIWLTAAVGVAVGLGRMWIPVLGTTLALLVLSVVRRLERRIRAPRGPA